MKSIGMLLAGLAALQTVPAVARTILITNDDGLTSNVVALHDALKAAGHDVIVAVPCTNQSGMGAAIRFMAPLGPLAADCRNGAAKAGEPGAGPMTRPGLGPDYFYASGTPGMALFYGLDVAAVQRWGKAPDLVLSGPNEGQNAGPLTIASGTVGAAQYGTWRGVPSIALSAGADTADDAALANPKSAIVARRAAELVAFLDRRAGGDHILPPGIALNVNFPDDPAAGGWRLARVGSYSPYRLGFGADRATIGPNPAPPTAAQKDDEAVLVRSDATISVMQLGFGAPPAERRKGRRLLRGLVGR